LGQVYGSDTRLDRREELMNATMKTAPILWAFALAVSALWLGSCGSEADTSGTQVTCTRDAQCDAGTCQAGRCVTGGTTDPDATDVPSGDTPDVPEIPIDTNPAPDTDADTDVVEPDRGLGAPCQDPSDCDSFVCLNGSTGRFCAETCDGSCPPGYECRLFAGSGADFVQYCIPEQPVLCVTCRSDIDCGGIDDLCLERLDGNFCGVTCRPENRDSCPSGYGCQLVVRERADGSTEEAHQCIPDIDICGDCLDVDGDGYGYGPGCIDIDCDDTNPNIHPGMESICNGEDSNCSGFVDQGFDFMNDSANCGACGVICDGGRFCGSGRCVCDEGEVFIDGNCTPVVTTGIETLPADDISTSAARLNGRVSDLGTPPATRFGFCWSSGEDVDPASPDFDCTVVEGIDGPGDFSFRLTELIPGSTWSTYAYSQVEGEARVIAGHRRFTLLQAPTVITRAPDEIGEESAQLRGSVTARGVPVSSEHGFCYGEMPEPTLTDGTCVQLGAPKAAGDFASTVDELVPGVTYNVRAYATNTVATAYGEARQFRTLALPEVLTVRVFDVSPTQASVEGRITGIGSPAPSSHGLCISENASVDLEDATTTCIDLLERETEGLFGHTFGDLTAGTRYYAVAFAENTAGLVRGDILSFDAQRPVAVATLAPEEIQATSARLRGELLDVGVPTTTEYGFCYATNAALDDAECITITADAALGVFTRNATGLTPGSDYWVRAYAEHPTGRALGSIETFTTLNTPAVTTLTPENVTLFTALLRGELTNLGVPSPTQHGFCYGTMSTPTLANGTCSQLGPLGTLSSFTHSIDGLTPGTNYNVRAYATNDVGTSYGETIAFRAQRLPTVETVRALNIGTTSVTLEGLLQNAGFPTATGHGFCIGTAPTVEPGGLGVACYDLGPRTDESLFTRDILGLTPGTRYYFQAWAENPAGRVTGEVRSLDALRSPVIATLEAQNVGLTTATLRGRLDNVGVPATTDYGFCLSTNAAFTGALCEPLPNPAPLGVFQRSISALSEGTTYYFRAYADHPSGRVEGGTEIFTTFQNPVVRTDGMTTASTTSVTMSGTVLDRGLPHATARGFCVGTASNPSVGAAGVVCQTAGGGGAEGAFSATITGLSPGTAYFGRAWVQSPSGTFYGADGTATTWRLPSVQTTNVEGTGPTTLSVSGNVSVVGTPSITQHGFCYGTGANPVAGGPGVSCMNLGTRATTGSFTRTISGLSPDTRYYVSAFAENTAGRVYAHGSSAFSCSVNDVPDGVDRNCDGIDGDINGAIFVSPLGSDANAGTIASPMRNLQPAIARAQSQGRDVYVAAGNYTQGTLTLANGVSIYGGFATDWSRGPGNQSSIIHNGSIVNGRVVGVQGNNISVVTTIDRMTIQTPNITGLSGVDNYGFHCVSCPGLRLRNSTINTGSGSPGLNGGSGSNGSSGTNGLNGVQGHCDSNVSAPGGAGGSSTCSRAGGNGGAGRYGDNAGWAGGTGQIGTSGGSGGPKNGCSGSGHGQDGSNGSTGVNGSNGSGGVGGSFSGSYWSTSNGGSGTSGTSGNGGGGGGGGGGQGGTWCLNGTGSGGGGGGAGGCGGSAGIGGGGGGGSFGLFLVNSTGAQLSGNTISAGAGGRGGNGGAGGCPGAGGTRGLGASICTSEVGRGGHGGNGGNGGRGGHGAGGAGGPSYGVYRLNTSVSTAGNSVSHGGAGAGGTGGSRSCSIGGTTSGSNGSAGAAGAVF